MKIEFVENYAGDYRFSWNSPTYKDPVTGDEWIELMGGDKPRCASIEQGLSGDWRHEYKIGEMDELVPDVEWDDCDFEAKFMKRVKDSYMAYILFRLPNDRYRRGIRMESGAACCEDRRLTPQACPCCGKPL